MPGPAQPPDLHDVVTTTTVPGGSTILICTTGPSESGSLLDICTVGDPDGIRTIQVKSTETDQQQASAAFDCSSPVTSTEFKVPAGTRYRVFVTDCRTPRTSTTFVIRANGDVNPI